MSPLSIVKLLNPKNKLDITKVEQNLLLCTEVLELKSKQHQDVFLKCKQFNKDKKLKHVDFTKIESYTSYQIGNAIRLILDEYEIIDRETFIWLSLSLCIMNEKLSLFVLRTILCTLPAINYGIVEHLFSFLVRFSKLSNSSMHSMAEKFAKWLYHHDGDNSKQMTRLSNSILEVLRNYEQCFKKCPYTGKYISISYKLFSTETDGLCDLSNESFEDIQNTLREIKSEAVDINIANYFLKLCLSNQQRASNIFTNSENLKEEINHLDLVIRFLQNTCKFTSEPITRIVDPNIFSSTHSITKFDILVDRRRFKLKISIDSKISLITKECINLSYHIDGQCPLDILETAALMVDVVMSELSKLIINNLTPTDCELHSMFKNLDHRNVVSIAREISDRVRSLPAYFDRLKKESNELVTSFLSVENFDALPKLSAMQEVLEKIYDHITQTSMLWSPIVEFDRENQPSNQMLAEVSAGYTLIDYAIKEIEHTLIQNVGSNHLSSLSKLMKHLLEVARLKLEEFESFDTPDPDEILYNGPVQSLSKREKKLLIAQLFLQLDELKQLIALPSRLLHPKSSSQLIVRHSIRTNIMILLFSMVPSYRSYLGGLPVSSSSLNLLSANKRKSTRSSSLNVPTRLNSKLKNLFDGLNSYLVPMGNS